nr:ribonuclease H-like domain-containing protein [Tanacetum cinerariifolium]
PKPDLVFHTPPSDENEHLTFNVQLSPTKPEQDLPSTSSAPIIEDWVFDSEEEDTPKVSKVVPSLAQSLELVKTPRHSGLISPPPMSVAPPVPLRSHSSSKGFKRPKKTYFVCKSKTHLIKDCDFHARKLAQTSCAPRDIHKHNAPMKHSRIPLHKVSAATPKSKPVLFALAKTIGAARPTFFKTRPHIASYTVLKYKAPTRRPFIRHTTPNHKISPPRINAANPSAVSATRVNAANPSVVSAARVNTANPSTVSAARVNTANPSAVSVVGLKLPGLLQLALLTLMLLSHLQLLLLSIIIPRRFGDPKLLSLIMFSGKPGNPQQALKDKGVIDSGCGKITCKGKIKTVKLDFDDVYYVKELKFNLFSVSQMCDKKNNVLFTDTECLVLSSDFKLPDACQVLLRVPRENNMYNVNLKNIIPSGDL